MNSEVDLTKQCYQIWQKVSRQSGKKELPEMAKSRQSGQKVPKMEKKGFTVFELHGLGPLCLRLARRASRRRGVGVGPRRRRLAQGQKGPELVYIIFKNENP